MKPTAHGVRRQQDADRPSTYAQQDQQQPKEIYTDIANPQREMDKTIER